MKRAGGWCEPVANTFENHLGVLSLNTHYASDSFQCGVGFNGSIPLSWKRGQCTTMNHVEDEVTFGQCQTGWYRGAIQSIAIEK